MNIFLICADGAFLSLPISDLVYIWQNGVG